MSDAVARVRTGILSPDAIGFESVVFARSGDHIHITVAGMCSAEDLELVVFESGTRTTVVPVGSWCDANPRPYSLSAVVDVEPERTIIVRGLHDQESIRVGDLPEDLPVVCSPDPFGAQQPGPFLHRRGTRYVLMSQSDSAPAEVA
ncbi:MAG: hypothetical protein ACR2PK_12345 [Acidimicrobiales bacterium]